jgi:hypothetical protein
MAVTQKTAALKMRPRKKGFKGFALFAEQLKTFYMIFCKKNIWFSEKIRVKSFRECRGNGCPNSEAARTVCFASPERACKTGIG